MKNLGVGISGAKIKFRSRKMLAAVHKRIAAFFYPTKFHITHGKTTNYEDAIKKTGAANLKRLCLFFVVKWRYITIYRSRAPPPILISINQVQNRRIT